MTSSSTSSPFTPRRELPPGAYVDVPGFGFGDVVFLANTALCDEQCGLGWGLHMWEEKPGLMRRFRDKVAAVVPFDPDAHKMLLPPAKGNSERWFTRRVKEPQTFLVFATGIGFFLIGGFRWARKADSANEKRVQS